jgi:hypothetical protein
MKRKAGHPREPKYRLRDSTCQTYIWRIARSQNSGCSTHMSGNTDHSPRRGGYLGVRPVWAMKWKSW